MREIKYRWWNGQRMIEHKNIQVQIYNLKNMENLMQYTGLKDKNGKEVYEGDIFNCKRNAHHPDGGYISGTYAYHPESAEVVRFEDGCFLAGNDYLHNRLFWYERHNWQLIGNIYESPQED